MPKNYAKKTKTDYWTSVHVFFYTHFWFTLTSKTSGWAFCRVYSVFHSQSHSVNQFLLSLKPSNRECMRKDLYQFFKFALRKRCIFTIPMTDYTTREVARVNYTLSFEEQAALARKIQDEGISYPYEHY